MNTDYTLNMVRNLQNNLLFTLFIKYKTHKFFKAINWVQSVVAGIYYYSKLLQQMDKLILMKQLRYNLF